MSFEIVPAALAVKSMRDNGYKNAAYALAELIDNSIQAGATQVDLLIGEKFSYGDRQKSNLDSIAIIDNGTGMDPDTLQIALQFGNGTHLNKVTQNGIGKFGMGLPAASISQCKKVEVYTWQNGIENAFYTYIDIDEISKEEMNGIPKPEKKQIPFQWKEVSNNFGISGTLIIWNKIDRCHWKKGNTIIRHSENLIGRIYRRFLEDGKIHIRMLAFDIDGEQKSNECMAKPNDPLYLMNETSCPEPWAKIPMFVQWGNDSIHEIKFRGELHKVIVKYSIAKPESRSMPNAGRKPHGEHASKNLGVSITRADREISLDRRWATQYDPMERWWGIELDFPPALDEVFGLTNNKQSASFFEDLALENIEELIKEGTYTQYLSELKENEDPAASLIGIASEITRNLRIIRKELKKQNKGTEVKNIRSSGQTAEEYATDATKKRMEEGHVGISDEGENEDPVRRIQGLEIEFTEEGYPNETAKLLAEDLIYNGQKFFFTKSSVETSSFFTIRNKAGVIIISLNTEHPAYPHLIELLEQPIAGTEDLEVLTERLQKARNGLFLLLAAWARYEDEQIHEKVRDQLKDSRSDWGRVARDFLKGDR